MNNIRGALSDVTAGFGISTIPKSAIVENLEILVKNLPALLETSINLYYWNKTNPHPLTKRSIGLIKEEMKYELLSPKETVRSYWEGMNSNDLLKSCRILF